MPGAAKQLLDTRSPRDCHPERSPSRCCSSPDFRGRGTQFEGSAFSLGRRHVSRCRLRRKAARLKPGATLQRCKFAAVPFLRRGAALLRPAKDLGTLSPFGCAEHSPVHARDCACGECSRCLTGHSMLCPYQTVFKMTTGNVHELKCAKAFQRNKPVLIPEIVAVYEFDADLAAAVGIHAGINDVGRRTAALIFAHEEDRSACFDWMAAHKRRAVAAHRGSPCIFFPGAARIFPAQPHSHRLLESRASAQ